MNRCFKIFIVCIGGLLSGCPSSTGYRHEGQGWVFVYPMAIGDPAGVIAVKGADNATFHQLTDSEYAADKNFVYYRGAKIPDAIPSSFKHLQGYYWLDAAHVYDSGERIAGADPTSFKPLSVAPWSIDKDRCYRGRVLIPSGDPKTFVPINFHWAKDGSRYYAYNFSEVLVVPCDYHSMTMLSSTYAKDNLNVFWLGGKIDGADAATFSVHDEMGQDKFRRYSGPTEFWMDKKARETKNSQ